MSLPAPVYPPNPALRTLALAFPHPPTPLPPADFYYELGVQVVEACITARPFTGGLMELGLVHKYVQV